MKELPEELTPELLGLVLEEDTVIRELKPKIGYNQRLLCTVDNIEVFLNIDTLTRLILEAIEAKGYIYNLFNSTSIQGYVMIIDDKKYTAGTILEVALKHFARIAKEKGLINGR